MSPASPSSIALALQPAEGEHLRDAKALDRLAVARQRLHPLAGLDGAGADAAGQDAAEEGVGLERGGEHAERAGLDDGRRDVGEHQVEERRRRCPAGRPGEAAIQPCLAEP